jgi:hypothetical protein
MTDFIPASERLTLVALAKREGVHTTTVWRWALTGIKGHTMPSWNFAGRRVTSEQAFRDWLAILNDKSLLQNEGRLLRFDHQEEEPGV